jgi:ABC-type nitrate/sulfonate/bicarbonate transport system permease component
MTVDQPSIDDAPELQAPGTGRSLSASSAPGLRWFLTSRWGLRLLSLAVLATTWEALGRLDDRLLFPPLSRVLVALWELIWNGQLLAGFATSLQAWVIGFAISLAAAWWLAALMARFRTVELIANPYIDLLLAAPTIALVPLFVIWFGLGLTSRVGVIITFAFPIIAITAHTALRGIDSQLIEMGRAFDLRGPRLFWKIALPAAIPLLVAGLRLGASRAFVGMVVSDIILVSVGIGELIQLFNATFQTAKLFATILSVLLVAVLMIELFRFLERRIIRN